MTEQQKHDSPKWGLYWISAVLLAISVVLFVLGGIVLDAAGAALLVLAVASGGAAGVIAYDEHQHPMGKL